MIPYLDQSHRKVYDVTQISLITSMETLAILTPGPPFPNFVFLKYLVDKLKALVA